MQGIKIKSQVSTDVPGNTVSRSCEWAAGRTDRRRMGRGHRLWDRNASVTTNSSRGDWCWEELTHAEPWRSVHPDQAEPCKLHDAVGGFQANVPTVCRDDGSRKSGKPARPQASSQPQPGEAVGVRSCVQAVGRSAERPQARSRAAPAWVTADGGAEGELGSKLPGDQPSGQYTEERTGASLNQSTRRRHKRPKGELPNLQGETE